MEDFNVLSLFDGISCGQIALERAGIKVDNYFASEIDKNAIEATQTNYPKTIQLGDVTKVTHIDLPKISLLMGGFCCQSFSVAGNQQNFNDPRGKLFFECVRLLNECQPEYFLFENVKMKREYQDIISEKLGVEPILLNSSLVSAQMRKRLFWTNIPVNELNDSDIKLESIIENGTVDKEKSYCLDASYCRNSNPFGYIKKSRGTLVFDSLENLKRFREMAREELLSKEVIQEKCYRRFTQTELEKLQTLPVGYTSCLDYSKAAYAIGNGWTVDVIAHIFKGLK